MEHRGLVYAIHSIEKYRKWVPLTYLSKFVLTLILWRSQHLQNHQHRPAEVVQQVMRTRDLDKKEKMYLDPKGPQCGRLWVSERVKSVSSSSEWRVWLRTRGILRYQEETRLARGKAWPGQHGVYPWGGGATWGQPVEGWRREVYLWESNLWSW